MKLSVLILAINEAGHLADCVSSLEGLLAAPDGELVIVLDARATPEVERIARHATHRVFRHPFENFSAQRNFALSLARGEWVLFIDPDERLTPPLVAEIEGIIGSEDESGPQGYWIARRTFMFGHEVRHAGWWPDYQLRLLQRPVAAYDESHTVHEVAEVPEDRQARMAEPMIHYNYERLGQFVSKQRHYAAQEARAQWRNGIRAKPRNLVLQPIREFRRRFITLAGWKDGPFGLFLSLAMAYYNFKMYVRLWRLQSHTLTKD